MLIHSEAIVIHSLRYGENDLVVTLFTRTSGMRSYLVRGVLKSKKGKIRSSLFLPLSLLEIEAIHKDKGTLETLREAKILKPYQTLHTDIVKNSLIFFLSEMIKNAIQEQEPNEDLFIFLKTALLWLDTHQNTSNFHIIFLIKLTQYLGFYPDLSMMSYNYFDLDSGCFRSHSSGLYCIEGSLVEVFKKFLGTTFDESMKIRLTRTVRNEILNMLLVYFELHLHGFKKPKSLSILNKIFS